jgi:outer membrane protein assembly factor BamD (BamD/ComL family)
MQLNNPKEGPMKLFFAFFSMLMFSVACSTPKEEYKERQQEAQEEYNEEMKEAQEDYKEEEKEEAVDYVDDAEGATINRDESKVDVEE